MPKRPRTTTRSTHPNPNTTNPQQTPQNSSSVRFNRLGRILFIFLTLVVCFLFYPYTSSQHQQAPPHPHHPDTTPHQPRNPEQTKPRNHNTKAHKTNKTSRRLLSFFYSSSTQWLNPKHNQLQKPPTPLQIQRPQSRPNPTPSQSPPPHHKNNHKTAH